jgi:rhodanese-related sulfurtransferase
MPFSLIPASAAAAEVRAKGATCVLLDVRQPEEVRVACVPGATVIPMMEIPRRLAELDRTRRVLVFCHHGMRSQQVADFLVRSGYPDVASVVGGIDAWSVEVDPTIPRY